MKDEERDGGEAKMNIHKRRRERDRKGKGGRGRTIIRRKKNKK